MCLHAVRRACVRVLNYMRKTYRLTKLIRRRPHINRKYVLTEHKKRIRAGTFMVVCHLSDRRCGVANFMLTFKISPFHKLNESIDDKWNSDDEGPYRFWTIKTGNIQQVPTSGTSTQLTVYVHAANERNKIASLTRIQIEFFNGEKSMEKIREAHLRTWRPHNVTDKEKFQCTRWPVFSANDMNAFVP